MVGFAFLDDLGEPLRHRLVAQVAEVHSGIDYIDWKQGFYDDVRLVSARDLYAELGQ